MGDTDVHESRRSSGEAQDNTRQLEQLLEEYRRNNEELEVDVQKLRANVTNNGFDKCKADQVDDLIASAKEIQARNEQLEKCAYLMVKS